MNNITNIEIESNAMIKIKITPNFKKVKSYFFKTRK